MIAKRAFEKLEKELASLRRELKSVEDSGRSAFAKLNGVTLKGAEQLDALRAAMSRVNREQNALNDAIDTPEVLRRKIELKKEEIDLANSLYEAEQRAAQGQREAAKIIGDGFENAILSGEKLTDVIKQLGLDLMKLAFRNTITNPLVDMS
jgi:predicted  nucleic acid-binding Zn-ribbon protein